MRNVLAISENCHTVPFFLKQIQQSKKEFSDTLLDPVHYSQTSSLRLTGFQAQIRRPPWTGGGAADNVYEGARTYIFGECGDFVGWAVMLQAHVTTAITCGNVVAGPTFRKSVARSNEGWVAEGLVPLRSRVFGVRFGAATGGCDVRREVHVTALCGKQVYCWRQVTLVRTDAETRWADASRPATVRCGARASWNVQHAAATHMLQALRRRGAVIARIQYMAVPLAAVRDLRAPNVPEEPGYCLRSTDQAAPQFRGGDLRRDSGAKAHSFREMGWKHHASNPMVVRCVVSPCHEPPDLCQGVYITLNTLPYCYY